MSQIVTKFITNNAVTNAKLAQMPAHTFKGNNTAGTANAMDLTKAEMTAEMNLFTSALQGVVPASGGGTVNFLRADGTFADPNGNDANRSLSNLITTSINQTLLPDSNVSRNIGSALLSWNAGYFQQIYSTGALTLDGATGVNLQSTTEEISLKSKNNIFNPSLLFFEASNTYSVAIKAPSSLAASYVLTLPVNDGNSGQFLQTDGSGVTSWVSPAAAAINNKQLFVLSSTDITNQYIDLAQVAKNNSISFVVKGGGIMIEGASYDYSVSYTGGAGGNTRITFLNELATGGLSALVAADVVVIQYQY